MCMPQHVHVHMQGEVSVCHVYKFGHTALETIVFGGSSKYLLHTVPGCTNLLQTVPGCTNLLQTVTGCTQP